MLALTVIKELQSAWPSPVTLVVKPGKLRLYLNARKVSSVTVKMLILYLSLRGLLAVSRRVHLLQV